MDTQEVAKWTATTPWLFCLVQLYVNNNLVIGSFPRNATFHVGVVHVMLLGKEKENYAGSKGKVRFQGWQAAKISLHSLRKGRHIGYANKVSVAKLGLG